jgi:hypothetical protein
LRELLQPRLTRRHDGRRSELTRASIHSSVGGRPCPAPNRVSRFVATVEDAASSASRLRYAARSPARDL